MLNFKRFLEDESGAGVVELILIIVVLIGIVLIFKEQVTKLVKSLFKRFTYISKRQRRNLHLQVF